MPRRKKVAKGGVGSTACGEEGAGAAVDEAARGAGGAFGRRWWSRRGGRARAGSRRARRALRRAPRGQSWERSLAWPDPRRCGEGGGQSQRTAGWHVRLAERGILAAVAPQAGRSEPWMDVGATRLATTRPVARCTRERAHVPTAASPATHRPAEPALVPCRLGSGLTSKEAVLVVGRRGGAESRSGRRTLRSLRSRGRGRRRSSRVAGCSLAGGGTSKTSRVSSRRSRRASESRTSEMKGARSCPGWAAVPTGTCWTRRRSPCSPLRASLAAAAHTSACAVESLHKQRDR